MGPEITVPKSDIDSLHEQAEYLKSQNESLVEANQALSSQINDLEFQVDELKERLNKACVVQQAFRDLILESIDER